MNMATNQSASTDRFEHPSEYLAAMQSIGWHPVAMVEYGPKGEINPMGVNENTMPGVSAGKNWDKFRAIQMRVPVQRPADYPPGDWWKAVWQFLYDAGLREDVTRPKQEYRA